MDFHELLNNSGLALAIFGYIGYVIKDIPHRILFFLEQNFTYTISLNSRSNLLYFKLVEYLNIKIPKLKKHHVRLQHVGYKNSKVNNDIVSGTYLYWIDKCTICRVTKTENVAQVQSAEYYRTNTDISVLGTLHVSFIGINGKKYLEECQQFIQINIMKQDEYTVITWKNGDAVSYKRTLDTYYIKHEIKEKILTIIENFKKNAPIYKAHGIPYKLGILLYGPPGSGKSTLAKIIASMIDANITYYTKSYQMFNYYDPMVYLIEEIDSYKKPIRDENAPMHAYGAAVTDWKDFLNFLDGPISPNNSVFIATTNHIKDLDPALIREGRFDYKFEIGYMDEYIAKEMCDGFGVSYDILKEVEFPCPPPVLQNKILYQLNNKKSDDDEQVRKDLFYCPTCTFKGTCESTGCVFLTDRSYSKLK